MSLTDTALQVQYFETCAGARIFQIPVHEFPILWGHVYVVLVDDAESGPYRVLVDTGSGYGESNQHLEAGLQQASLLAGEPVNLENLTHIFITHGHIDHFGGLTHIRPRTNARIGVHELDLRNLTNYEERLTVVARRLAEFLIEAGISAERRRQLIELYLITKSMYRSVQVDFTYEAAGMRVGPFEMLHVPGHCAGHVVIRLHDVVFSGDHVLEDTSPHQSPEALTLSTGLEHYLKSLDELELWAEGVNLTLSGHKKPISSLPDRIAAIRQVHRQRLDQVLDLLVVPHNVAQVSQALFGEVHGYNVLLALEEAGAHVEYLYQRGLLGIANLAELETSQSIGPVFYQRIGG